MIGREVTQVGDPEGAREPGARAGLIPGREAGAIRKEGIAYDDEEYMRGLRCMAAPIKDFSGRTIAAMSLSMFKHKMTAGRRAFFKEALFVASADVSEKLGYLGGSKKIAV